MAKGEKLAIYGGKPVRDMYLPYGSQWVDESDMQAVIHVLKGDWLTTGPHITAFERKVAGYVGTNYAVAFSNGTAALHAACFAAGITSGDEVLTTPITFAATANCILYCGAKPVFVDIDPETYLISPEQLTTKINHKTKAIIPVDYTGNPVDYQEIMRIAKGHGLVVIADAAHALGATYHGDKVGSIADMTMFSFHPVKHITTGEGGIITTNDKSYYEKLILFRSHGITRDKHLLTNHNEPWYYEMHELGYNYRMTDIQAALGISQLAKLEDFLLKRKAIATTYTEAFQTLNPIIVPKVHDDRESSWHLYVIRLDLSKLRDNRQAIFKALIEENIGVNVHYIPVYFHPYYQKLGYQKGLCPHAEAIYKTIITLPLFPKMNPSDVEDVISAVKKVISYYEV
ncbi:UDP-4-amino-4,6-dideoxy-N-acetyl-beta-L-altrosamine transaminase [Ornithinibacillus sp. 179-J 7C1 HS]|uniref:UDP-4-amino-4, 6-dideoxy-N-acetyl-beta-L-altrosamine transaminase n=1 Tax=Ornithinibacillus sp. 179-J 7C1 HS TaxID=3142384 RepID=UPI0039A14383